MKLRIKAEVAEAKGAPRKCLSFDAATEFENTCEEHSMVGMLAEKMVELIADTVMRKDAEFNSKDIEWNGSAASLHIGLREKKSTLQRECPMYRDMGKPFLPEKSLSSHKGMTM